MSLKKSWRERLASYPHLPTVKEILAAMRPWRGEGSTVTTAIFAHMVALAAKKAPSNPAQRAPWWRTLKISGELHPKYPSGIEAQMPELQAEGHTVVQRGKRYFVEDFTKKLTGTR